MLAHSNPNQTAEWWPGKRLKPLPKSSPKSVHDSHTYLHSSPHRAQDCAERVPGVCSMLMNATPQLCLKGPLAQFQGSESPRRPAILPQGPHLALLASTATANTFHNFRNHVHLQRIGSEWSPQSWAPGSPRHLLEGPHSSHYEQSLWVSRLDSCGSHLPSYCSLTHKCSSSTGLCYFPRDAWGSCPIRELTLLLHPSTSNPQPSYPCSLSIINAENIWDACS